jgi:hypothetical protein
LRQIADALLNDVVSDANGFSFVRVVFVRNISSNAKCSGMEWCLGDEAVWERDAENAGNERGKP